MSASSSPLGTAVTLSLAGDDSAGLADDTGAVTSAPASIDVVGPAGIVEAPAVEDFDAFVVARGGSLVRTAYLIVGDAGAAQDVVQIALVKVARRWARIAGAGDPLPYVRTAVVRTAISWRRRRWLGETASAALPERPGADALGAVDTRDTLRRALATLPRRQRAAVVLRHYLDLDERATADVLGCSIGTVKSQTAKALSRLRVAIAADDERR